MLPQTERTEYVRQCKQKYGVFFGSGTHSGEQTEFSELSRAAVAVGSEGRGLSAEILSKCEKTIKIPMSPRCESLNAAVAASVVLWEMYR